MIQAVHDAGAKVKLHICGNINPVMELIAQTGADMVDCDYMVDMDRAAQILPRDCCICGNFDPVTVMYEGTPEMVRQATRKCMALSRKNNNFVAPGCEIPKDTPVENLLTMKETLEDNQ